MPVACPHPRPYRGDSVFGPGPRRRLDREARAVWRCKVLFAYQAGRITRAGRDIALALLKRHGVDGRLDPALATIAEDAQCSESTVLRQLKALADCGLLRWVRRLVRVGWRTEQTSNSYELMTPETIARCDRQRGGQTRRKIFPTATQLGGDDEWGRWNAQRQLAIFAEMMAAEAAAKTAALAGAA